MARQKKIISQTPQKKKSNYTEAKGLFLIAIDILFFLSLISFCYKDPSKNFLGIIGYFTAWTASALFGLGSYLIALFLGWIGWKYLSNQEFFNFKFSTLCFAIFLICSCILLNVFAEQKNGEAAIFANRIFSETKYIALGHKLFTRFNLGGIPFYFIYCDLPVLNLQNLLSTKGTVLIFSTSAIVSFLLLSNIRVIPQTKFLLLKFGQLLKKSLSFFKTLPQTLLMNLKKVFFERKKQNTESSRLLDSNKKTSTAVQNPILPPPISKKEMEADITKDISTKVIISRDTSLNNLKELNLKSKESSYHLPSPKLLSSPPKVDTPLLMKELKHQAEILEATLKNFGINAKVGEINCGPTITSFEVHPSIGVKVQKIQTLEKDIALNLEAKSIRIVAPIPGKAAVGVEIPSIHPQPVSLKEMLIYYHQLKKKQTIPLLLGKTVSGDHVITDLVKMPHLLIAGATGSGKSVCINTMVMSILMNLSPDEIKLLMVDPKKVELTQYSNLPHMIAPVITEPHGAYAALHWLVKEMQKRYEILKQLGLRNITAFNHRKIKKDFEESLSIEIPEKMAYFVAIIDEFADLMMVSSSDLETPIARIAQMARAVGIHLILATQRPSREVITGIIKANFPSRIAFKVASRVNSQIILDENGAETLLGNGDLLFLPPGSSHLVRAQGAYISDDEISTVISHINEKNPPAFLIPSFDAMKKDPETGSDEEPKDKLYDEALAIVLQSRNASTTFLQRKLKIGYARAASLMDELEANKIIGPQEGSKPRRILSNLGIQNPED